MDLLTLLPILEQNLTREVVGYNGEPTITYKGTITKVTVNSTDEFTNVYQLLLIPDATNGVELAINHHARRHLTQYKISNITTLTIT